eukprot:CAMPEP_0184492070 /NCGR_PEP_ID=MMETSP0113_2-20130426/22205_1 /TAXON_ID=91329 /ORGANISM="Norrisiella sphaerica, Strain BC52" /LENGTH=472 /DNA_ID=CAMNT_0026876705 /DNA_START=312 /DNA_END=1730 /DNA_ORIENTATION=-
MSPYPTPWSYQLGTIFVLHRLRNCHHLSIRSQKHEDVSRRNLEFISSLSSDELREWLHEAGVETSRTSTRHHLESCALRILGDPSPSNDGIRPKNKVKNLIDLTEDALRDSLDALPPGWTEYLDSRSGMKYYHNSELKVTTWTRPQTRSQGMQLDKEVQGVIEAASKEIQNLDPKAAVRVLDGAATAVEDLKVPRILSPVTGGLALGLDLTSGLLEKGMDVGSGLYQKISTPKTMSKRTPYLNPTEASSTWSATNVQMNISKVIHQSSSSEEKVEARNIDIEAPTLATAGGALLRRNTRRRQEKLKQWLGTNLRVWDERNEAVDPNPPWNGQLGEGSNGGSSSLPLSSATSSGRIYKGKGSHTPLQGWDLVIDKLYRIGQIPIVRRLAGDANVRLFLCVLFILGFSTVVKSMASVLPQAIIVTVAIIAYRFLGNSNFNSPSPRPALYPVAPSYNEDGGALRAASMPSTSQPK